MKFFIKILFIFLLPLNAYNQLWKQYADSAYSFYDERKLERAREYGDKARELFPKDSLWTNTYARMCNDLANLYRYLNKHKEAESIFLEVKEIREKVLGNNHPDYATTLGDLAFLYDNMGQYEKAEPLYIEAKQIMEKAVGKNDIEYASACTGLAILYSDIGQYKKSEALYLEARGIIVQESGKDNTVYAANCFNLGGLYIHMGQYEKAEPLSLEAKKIRKKILGAEDPDYAASCEKLAEIYSDMGQFEKAEPLFLESKQIWEKVFGKNHSDYGLLCNNLANFYDYIEEHEKAVPLYLEAMDIFEKIYGKGYFYAISCGNLAGTYMKMDQFEKAESLFLEALNIVAKIPGKEHPDYAADCNNLADLYSTKNLYEKAELLYLEARQIREKALGKENFDYIESCMNLGNLYKNLNEPKKANNFYEEAFQSQSLLLKKIFQFSSEADQQSYVKKIANREKIILSFNLSGYSHSSQGNSFTISLSSRNLILSSLQKLRNTIYYTSDTSVKNKYNNWINTREQISFWQTKSISSRPAYVKTLEEQANNMEKELTLLSSAFKREQQDQEVNWKSVQTGLSSTEAAIEFKEFNYFDGKRWTDSIYYIALVLRKNKPEPELVQLFEKKQLDSLLKYKKTSPGQQRLNVLYSVEEATGNKNLKKSLYDFIWKPLEEKLKGINTVYYAPAGTLYKIAFAALPVTNKEVLSDKYQLVQLNTTASVADRLQTFVSASDKIMLYGGVQYDADSTSIKKAALQYNHNDVATRSVPEDLLREGVGDFYFLKGTEQEVNQIEKLAGQYKFNATVTNGMMATEESFKNLSGKNSPVVLHIATHGFFFPDPKNEKKDERVGGAIVFKQSDNPLIRSGLALAGANNAWKGKPVTGVEDGILTSYEVSNMYLPNTKLVVLSACETGLGDIQGSEGVYGLQRAFKMAGVQNLVMSLWRVDDIAASEFMQQFYKNLFAKQTINDAFYNAQTVMKNKYRNDPYKWAAWVLVR